ECLGARDPYCGWDDKQKRCTTIEDSSNMSLWTQNITECPEYKTCNPESCPEVRRNTPWTPWMPVNITQNGARQEQRFRYTCRAQLSDPHELQFGRKKTESRFCPNDGSAMCETDSLVDDLLKTGKTSARIINGGWSFWGAWSSCSRDCELGFRIRKRTCTNPEPKNGGLPCVGSATEYQDCNPHPCPGNHDCLPARNSESSFSIHRVQHIPTSLDMKLLLWGPSILGYKKVLASLSRVGLEGEMLGLSVTVRGLITCMYLFLLAFPYPPVKGSWSCWTPWSQCSATCGGGHYQRTRTCTNPAPSSGEDICIGLHTEEALCNTHPCEGSHFGSLLQLIRVLMGARCICSKL
ncbi:UNVERIFIED_CONTAM: hypothetical protein H355_008771, partial [Colinus virginianus]